MRNFVFGVCLMTAASSYANEIIEIDGSSTVYPIMEAVAEEFSLADGNEMVHVTVGVSGTGGGFKRFCRGELDIANASRPIKQEEIEICAEAGVEFQEILIGYDALSVIVSTENTFVNYLTVDELKRMWETSAQQKITSWKQIRDEFPDVPLKLAGPGTDSGTFDYWTEVIVGEAKASRADYQASEDDNITVRFVSRDKNALGYLGLAYYLENQGAVRAVPIGSREEAVVPSVKTAKDGTYTPLTRPLYIYVEKSSIRDRKVVRDFIEFIDVHGQELVEEVGFIGID